MKSQNKYQWVFEDEVLIRKFKGKIYVDDIISSWEFAIENNLIEEHLKGVISDFTQAEFNMSFSDLEKIIAYVKKNKVLRDLKLAVLINSPDKIVFPAFAAHQHPEIDVRPFSTKQAAIEWINE